MNKSNFLIALLLPWVALASPFEISFPNKKELSSDDYVEVQNQIRQVDITPLMKEMFAPLNRHDFAEFDDFWRRCTKCIRQTLIDPEKGLYPEKELVKIGRGGDRCVVCCAPFNGKYPDFTRSLVDGLKQQGFNGYFLYYIGGWPNPTGEEIKYAAVPYSFKIFAMVEAHLLGFNNVLWIDAACFPLRNIEPLFDRIEKNGYLLNWFYMPSVWPRFIIPQTRSLLKQLTGTDVFQVPYVNTTVFGLQMNKPEVQELIETYYDYVRLGTPFLSCFPEEWVFTAIIGKKKYRSWTALPPPPLIQGSFNDADDAPAEFDAVRQRGYYFYHRKGRY